jgi:L-amino acid N-acyltransferase YncA
MIRLARTSDANEIAEIYAPIVRGTAISFETEPPGEAEIEKRIASTLAYAPWLVWEDDAGLGGYVYASRHHERAAYQWSVDVAVYIHETRRRTGAGRALYTALLSLLRIQGFHAAHAGITLPNAASVGLHEALGFRRVGMYPAVGFKLGAWHDVGWWQLRLCESIDDPPPPLSVAQAQALPSWQMALDAAHAAR